MELVGRLKGEVGLCAEQVEELEAKMIVYGRVASDFKDGRLVWATPALNAGACVGYSVAAIGCATHICAASDVCFSSFL